MCRFVPVRLVLFLAAVGSAAAPAPAADAGSELKEILAEAWEFQLREEPLFATRVGDKRYNDRLPSVAPADFDRRAAFARQILVRLDGLDRSACPKPTGSTTTCSGAR